MSSQWGRVVSDTTEQVLVADVKTSDGRLEKITAPEGDDFNGEDFENALSVTVWLETRRHTVREREVRGRKFVKRLM